MSSSSLEHQVLRMWESILEARPIGPTDDFYDLGGDSLAAIELVLQVKSAFGVELPIEVVLRGTTVSQIAALLREAEPAAALDRPPEKD